MNNINIIGNLTREPELTAIDKGATAVCKFGVAVNRRFQKNGERVCDFFNVVVWGKLAESCGKFLSKGKKVAVSGEMQMDRYTNAQGVETVVWNIRADMVEFLPSASKTQHEANDGLTVAQQTELKEIDDEGLPF